MILRLGSKGDDVARLQRSLMALGAPITEDGFYGARTERAVRSFQAAHGLVADGVAGPVTQEKIASQIPRERPYPEETVMVGNLIVPRHRCWPLRMLPDGRRPVVTSSFREPSRPRHHGADLFYRYQPGDPPMPIGDGGRERNWWIPPGTIAVAQADGIVELAGSSRTGHRVWVRHAGGLATGGFHFSKSFVFAGQTLRLGTPLGVVSDNPADRDADHLHAELYMGDVGSIAKHHPRGCIDPELFWIGAELLKADL